MNNLLSRLKIQKGFTLLELLITLSIIVILTMLAIWVFTSYAKKSRRADAMNTIMAISLAEERYRAVNTQYGTLAQVWTGSSTPGGYYTVSISNNTATGYTISATAQGGQASDAENAVSCTTLQLVVSAGTATKSPTACWPE